MESKKINQLATELTPALSDLTIIGDPSTGISKKITLSQMASLFTGTVEEYANLAAFPLVGVADTIYIALDTNVLYRWNTGTNAYVELSPNIINSLVFSDANGFDGNISLVGSTATLTITTALTQGSVGFIGASGALTQDNSNFYWDNTNKRLGINTNAPTTAIDAFGSGIIGRLNGTSTNNAFLGFASAGSNKWSIGNVQSDHRFRIYNEATTSELVSVLQTGEFGIGIANPTTKLHIDGGASALIANLDANVSVAKSISFRSDNSNRINLEVSGTESGSNAGANFFIRRYSDAGALIDTPFTITRSTGAISLTTALSATTAIFSGTVQFGTTSGYTTASEGQFFSKGGGSIYIANLLAAAATLKAIQIQRNDIERFSIGLNASDSLAFINASGTSVANITSTGAATFSSNVTIGGSSTLDSLKVGVNSTHQLLIGADSSYAEIQAITQGVGYTKNLILQRQGANVGIGTSIANKKLHIVDTAEQLRIGYDNTVYSDFRNDSSGGLLINTSSSYIIHYIGGSLKFRINSNGFIGNGPDSPLYNFDLTGNDNSSTSTYLRVFSNNRTVWTGIGYQRLETNGTLSIVSGGATYFNAGGGLYAILGTQGFFASTRIASDVDSKTFMNSINTDCGLIPTSSGTTMYLYSRSGGTNYRALLTASTYFTGQHGNKPINEDLKTNIEDYVGLIVSSVGSYYSVNPITNEITTGIDAIQISESLPEIKLTDKDEDKSVWGVVTNVKNDNYNTDGTTEYDNNSQFGDRLGENVIRVNGLGEGAIWVTNINGNIENGDYICSSIIAGYGKKQNDDLLHNYTVAKSTMDCDFDLNNEGLYKCEEFEYNGQTYKKAFIGCTYHCS